MLWIKVAAALKELSVTLEIVVWIFDTYGNNLEIKNYFTKYLKHNFFKALGWKTSPLGVNKGTL